MQDHTEREALSSRLREALATAGLKPIELSEKTGIPKSMVSYYMTGKSTPKADRLFKMAVALDVSEAWLMGYDVPKGRTPDQKKNDALASVVVRLRTDAAFREAVLGLNELSEEKLKIVTPLLRAF